IKELNPKSTIIAVPSLSLVKQTLEVYLREMVANKASVKWLCICSDEGIGKNDDVAFFTDNLGVPCQTDPNYIESWLKANKEENKVIFTTYQSGRIIAELSKKLKITFDVGIFDEAHKTVGAETKLFSHLLFEKNINITKRVFMTATERFYAGSRDDIISMDDEDIYGETFTQMSFKEAIDAELLTDYKVITIDIKKSEIAEFIKDNNLVQLNSRWKKETEARSLASMLALRKAMKRFNIKNAVSFHSSIEKAVRNKELQKYITETYNYKPIDTYTVSGKIPTTKRNDIVQEFAKSPKALITNARCLTEGVDVPNIDCIVFADPRKSKVDIVQALGRALRKKDGKDWGYVILPVVYDGDTNEIDNDNFNEILSIVRGLAANDERIVEYFKDKSLGEGSKGKSGGVELFEMISETLSESDFAEQLSIKLWEKLSRFSWMPFEGAREYVRKLNLKSVKEWEKFNKNELPNNIPSSPRYAYKDKGWISWGDWLGTGFVSLKKREYLPFNQAREYVWELGLKNNSQWSNFCKSGEKPSSIPSNPRIYNEFLSIPDWIGTRKGWTGEYLPFSQARKIVREFNLRNNTEWLELCKSEKLPADIPKTPREIYKEKGWVSLGDWLGNGRVADGNQNWLSCKKAQDFVVALNLKSGKEWKNFCLSGQLPSNIPKTPWQVYKNDGWVSMGEWLGTRIISTNLILWREFKEARKFARNLKLKNFNEWLEFTKADSFPRDIPAYPNNVYKNLGWKGNGDWLGYQSNFDKEFVGFDEAKQIMIDFGIKSVNEYRVFYKKNKSKNLPAAPNLIYKNKGWTSFGDFFGTYKKANYDIKYRKFEDARDFARNLNLNSVKEWREWCSKNNLPKDISASPHKTYKESGWISW
ncbi:MAG: helicase-related protein, partial [Proteobacteria bacterium]|nr:helicase-related protein [Pseudomonadota bacterium]